MSSSSRSLLNGCFNESYVGKDMRQYGRGPLAFEMDEFITNGACNAQVKKKHSCYSDRLTGYYSTPFSLSEIMILHSRCQETSVLTGSPRCGHARAWQRDGVLWKCHVMSCNNVYIINPVFN